jgi:hypothetical protein
MTLYYVETGRGCGIRRARSVEQARRKTLREVGTYEGVRLVREATQRDLNWVRGMGGSVPADYAQTRSGLALKAQKDERNDTTKF